ncbi:MAG: hypothetical protein UX02_C0002G0057 [Candidatus Moranbacteria bacterium GW2011_GWC1_45_18]|nr:MAG: hypothetical protein UT79_C0001G0404 [Candidatus Moranbacteria bacterium GW2011_GWC2_40_12]KKT32356.1 MAG: hypothetical protein UW19_C0023G0010 [Candidatus Moranbacteria bacterium GW2011_GWF2_44_10]KKT99738.1 MAG: hypothetical protein UX02_C0002G0057 [Candidatus Moranbacteria bacterium GW2011_GWC1_45_18]
MKVVLSPSNIMEIRSAVRKLLAGRAMLFLFVIRTFFRHHPCLGPASEPESRIVLASAALRMRIFGCISHRTPPLRRCASKNFRYCQLADLAGIQSVIALANKSLRCFPVGLV